MIDGRVRDKREDRVRPAERYEGRECEEREVSDKPSREEQQGERDEPDEERLDEPTSQTTLGPCFPDVVVAVARLCSEKARPSASRREADEPGQGDDQRKRHPGNKQAETEGRQPQRRRGVDHAPAHTNTAAATKRDHRSTESPYDPATAATSPYST